MSDGAEMKNKRNYTTRKGEWGEMTPEEVFNKIVTDITPALKVVDTGIKTLEKEGKPADSELVAKQKELTNLRVRAYARIRALGGNVKALRQAHKEQS